MSYKYEVDRITVEFSDKSCRYTRHTQKKQGRAIMLPRKDGQRLQSAQCPSNASAHQVMPLRKSLRPLMVSLYWLDKHRHIVRQREFFADEAYIAIDELVAQGHIRALEHRVKGGRGVSAGLHFHGNESTLALNHEVDLAQLRGFLVVVGRVNCSAMAFS